MQAFLTASLIELEHRSPRFMFCTAVIHLGQYQPICVRMGADVEHLRVITLSDPTAVPRRDSQRSRRTPPQAPPIQAWRIQQWISTST